MRYLLSKPFVATAFLLFVSLMSSALAKGVIIGGPKFP